MKPREYRLFAECLENGLRRGYRRAHKYCENPSEDQILESLQTNVMGEITEFFAFAPDEDAE
jgi:hypothetical protein